jgi:hypothetical protein
VTISGRAAELDEAIPLSLASRDRLATVLRTPIPVQSRETIEKYVGTVREIDLDARRFELRQIVGVPKEEIRCAYLELHDAEAKNWLDRKVQVSGPVVRDSKGTVRMLQVSLLETIDVASPEQDDEGPEE